LHLAVSFLSRLFTKLVIVTAVRWHYQLSRTVTIPRELAKIFPLYFITLVTFSPLTRDTMR
jgi:hypothetical protein